MASLNTKQLVDDAATMDLKIEVASGRVRIEGRLGDVKRVFAAQGCDLVREGATGHAAYMGDHHGPATFVASICSVDPSYAYGYTCPI